jgi:hypothetical protein
MRKSLSQIMVAYSRTLGIFGPVVPRRGHWGKSMRVQNAQSSVLYYRYANSFFKQCCPTATNSLLVPLICCCLSTNLKFSLYRFNEAYSLLPCFLAIISFLKVRFHKITGRETLKKLPNNFNTTDDWPRTELLCINWAV